MKKTKKENIKFPQYISTSQKTVRVVGAITSDKNINDYKNGKGYIRDDKSIWIYCEQKPNREIKNTYPYFWFNEKGEMEFSNPTPIMRNIYQISSLKDISVATIIDNTGEDENFYNEKELLDISSATSVYVPYIRNGDDPWKILIKLAILMKGIDINRLKSKTNLPYQIPNMRTALTKNTKMSVKYFEDWMNLLQCEYEITINDKNTDPGKPDQLGKRYTFVPSTGKFYAEIDGQRQEIDYSRYERKINVADIADEEEEAV